MPVARSLPLCHVGLRQKAPNPIDRSHITVGRVSDSRNPTMRLTSIFIGIQVEHVFDLLREGYVINDETGAFALIMKMFNNTEFFMQVSEN